LSVEHPEIDLQLMDKEIQFELPFGPILKDRSAFWRAQDRQKEVIEINKKR